MNWYEALDPVFSTRLCLTLLHSIWQVAALAMAAWLIDRGWRRPSVERSYAIHVATLMAALVALPLTYYSIDVSDPPSASGNATVSSEQEPLLPAPYVVSDAGVRGEVVDVRPGSATRPSIAHVSAVSVEADRSSTSTTAEDSGAVRQRATAWAVVAYAAGVVLMLARLLLAIVRANRLRRRSMPLTNGPLVESITRLADDWSMKVVPALATVRQTTVPHVVGLLRPTILLPAAAVGGMSTAELELILLHELAHIRRHDMWVHLLQRLCETFLFFNPALWLLSRRISALREYCCDDIACPTPSDAQQQLRYASALLRIVELGSSRAVPDPASLAATGSSPSELRRRVARLFGEPVSEPLRFSRSGLRGLIGALALLACGPLVLPEQQHHAAATHNAVASPSAAQSDSRDNDTAPRAANNSSKQFQLLVTGPDGNAVASARVEIRSRPGLTKEQVRQGTFDRKGRYGTFFKTDPAGRLTIDLPTAPTSFRVSIEQPGYGPYWTGWATDTHPEQVPDRFTAQLDAGWSVGGVVVDEQGRPIKGAKVRPGISFKKRPGDPKRLGVGTTLRTDAEGRWRYDSVPSSMDRVGVSVNHTGYQALRLGLERSRFELKDNAAPSTRITLNSGLSVVGTVTDEAGTPLEGVRIRTKFINEIRETKTDAEGKYRLAGCEPRKARIVVSAKGYATDMQEIRIDQNMPAVDFTMQPGRTIRVRVVDEQGKGIPKARIFFQRWRTGLFQYFEFDHIGQYTDENGVWEWNEAPVDEFQADICRPGGMQMMYQKLIARDEEYVFRPPKALVVSGRVVDVATKKPIMKFRAVPGTFNEPGQRQGDNWQRDDSYVAKDGTYRITRYDVAPAHMIRIEAEGYQVATSRRIRSDEGETTVDFELQPAKDITVQVLDNTGEAAARAKVALGIAGSQISIQGGDFRDRSTFAIRLQADEQGRFRIPSRSDPFQLVILHEDGFAHVKSADGPIPAKVQLTPWARAEGTFRVGSKIVPNVRLSLDNHGGINSYGENAPSIFSDHEATTGGDGRFVFERVFPGRGRIGRDITMMVDQGATEVTSSHRVPVEFVSGETTTLNLGGTGRPVVGKLVPPSDDAERVDWRFATIDVEMHLPGPEWPEPPADVQKDEAQRNAWWLAWQQSDEGRAFLTRYQAYQDELTRQPQFWATIDRDGTFRIDDVPPGKYILSLRFNRDAPGTLPAQRVIVPTTDGSGPFDLGVLALDAVENE